MSAGAVAEIRLLLRSDAPAYRTLMLQAYDQSGDAFTTTGDERRGVALSWWEDRIAHPKGSSAAFGAWVGATLVGTAAVEYETKVRTRHKATLLGMYVEPSQRGRGLGKQLVTAVLEHARRRPGTAIVGLTLTDGNAAARRLYESCGFTAWGVEPFAIVHEGAARAKVHMACRLDAGSTAHPASVASPSESPR